MTPIFSFSCAWDCPAKPNSATATTVTNSLLVFIAFLRPLPVGRTVSACGCQGYTRSTLNLKHRSWEALTAGRRLLSCLNKQALHQPRPGGGIKPEIGEDECKR